jgi:signal transduction histidine kinase/ligand-binding sensor domain-containing protein
MRVRYLLALTAILYSVVVLCCTSALALDPAIDVTQYAHTAWKIREGFSRGSIYSIAQTPDGYLWLGTEFGLLRFDGIRAVPWQPRGALHLLSGTIRSLLVARDGTLWIGTNEGLASWKDGTLIQYSEFDGKYIFKLLEDHDGAVWVAGGGIPNGELCVIHKGAIHCYGEDGTLGRGVFNLYEDTKGNLWAGVADGLWKWRPGPPKYYPFLDQPDGIQALGEDTDGVLLIGWKGVVHRFVDGKVEAFSRLQFRATVIGRDHDGGLWIGTQTQGLVHIHQGRTDVFGSAEGLSGDDVRKNSLFEDREGSIWVATANGLDRFRDFAATTLSVNQGLADSVAASVLADRDGSVWIGTYGGLNRWKNGRIFAFGGRDGKVNGLDPASLFQDDRGQIWVSNNREFGYLESNRFIRVSGVPGKNVLAIAQDTARSLWVASEPYGLFQLRQGGLVQQIPWAKLGHKDHASALAADPLRGGLWIGFFKGGVVYLSDGQIRASYTAADGLGGGRVGRFRFDPDGTVWVATVGGLSRVRNGRVATLTSKNGLPCDTVHWVIQDNDHSFWLYTACALVRIVRSELDTWAAAMDKDNDTKRSIRVTVFDSSDGVRSLSDAGHYSPQVARTSDGRIWFLPWDGVSIIDPHHLPFNKVPPPVHIEQVVADGKPQDLTQEVRLPALVRDVAIDYTALSLVVPERNHFRYKLEGQDPDWREVVNVRQVQYTNLAPRRYTFRVKASNNSGVWNETGASLEFSVLPAFYQTNWFRALCVVTFLALLWAIYQLRIHQLQYQLAIRLNERMRIARELHDTVLQTIQGSKLVADDALVDLTDPTRTRLSLQHLSAWLEQATKEGRAALRALQTSTTETNDLAAQFCQTLENCRRETSMEVQFAVTGDACDMHPVVRDEVYRIGCEAIRNACAHSRGTRLEVGLNYSQDLSVCVRDNGVGIDPAAMGKEKQGHLGLQGMRERAARIRSKLTVVSSPNSGTEVTLVVPGRIVFRKAIRRQIEKIRTRLGGLW